MVRNLMKFPSNVLVPIPIVGARSDPAFTMEERIVMRALVAGKTGKEICVSLRLTADLFHRLMRDLREKTGTDTNLSLTIWAQRRMKNCDQRVNTRDRYERPVSIHKVA
jgi:DNA-binding CsgD family transcriptional regulator